MVHGDDKGLILPPKIAPIETVIVPIFYNDSDKEVVLQKIESISQLLSNKGMSIYADTREQYTPGWKFNEWELKGVPLRIEIGPRDIKKKKITIVRRDTFEKLEVEEELIYQEIKSISEDIQRNLFKKAKDFMESHTAEVDNYKDFKKVLDEKGGFLKVFWCSKQECEEKIKEETGATIRLLSEGQEITSNCIYCGEKARAEAFFAKAY